MVDMIFYDVRNTTTEMFRLTLIPDAIRHVVRDCGGCGVLGQRWSVYYFVSGVALRRIEYWGPPEAGERLFSI